MKRILIPVFTTLLVACGDEHSGHDHNHDEVDLNQSLEELSEEINDPIWSFQGDGENFEIEIPSQMTQREDLNETAVLQYSYIEQFPDQLMENYIIVQMDEYENEDQKSEDLMLYASASMDSLMNNKKHHELLNEPKVDSMNNVAYMVHEVSAAMAVSDSMEIELFYVVGVYQGEKARYQAVSWTLMNQKSDFAKDMRRMIGSFKEL